jgi:hypothetical protein
MFMILTSLAYGLDRSELSFYAGFEGSLEAEIARGKKEPAETDTFRFAEGVIGKGVETKGRITYDYKRNVNVKEATISVWAQPIDWGTKDLKTGQRNFFTIHGSPAMQITSVYWGVTRFYMYYPGERAATNVYSYGNFWQPGRWRHLVATWRSEDEAQFFIDGARIGRMTDNVVAVQSGINFSFGAPKMVFDELMIFRRALKHEEVRALFYGVMKE